MEQEIFKALCQLLGTAFPDAEIYIGELPQQFTRPSILIENDGGKYDPEYNMQVGENTLYLTVVCFGRLTDGYRTENQLELMEMKGKVIGLFKTGRMQAGDRSIHVSASNGGEVKGEGYVDLTFTWLSNARVRDESGLPLMMELHNRNV